MTTRKLSEPTVKTTVRLFSADIERAKRLLPKLSISQIYRTVFRNHLDLIEKNIESRKELREQMAKEAPDAG